MCSNSESYFDQINDANIERIKTDLIINGVRFDEKNVRVNFDVP